MTAFIETQFLIARLSAESYKERGANNGQTLTRLGKWWGGKPLILVQADCGSYRARLQNPGWCFSSTVSLSSRLATGSSLMAVITLPGATLPSRALA